MPPSCFFGNCGCPIKKIGECKCHSATYSCFPSFCLFYTRTKYIDGADKSLKSTNSALHSQCYWACTTSVQCTVTQWLYGSRFLCELFGSRRAVTLSWQGPHAADEYGLMGGGPACNEGDLLVKHDGRWGAVCQTQWDIKDAEPSPVDLLVSGMFSLLVPIELPNVQVTYIYRDIRDIML